MKEKLELITLSCLALLAEVAVRTTNIRTLTRRLGIALDDVGEGDPIPGQRKGSRELSNDVIDRRAGAVDRLYRAWPRRASCLRRALVLGFYVRGARPTMRIGVAKENGTVTAHAWIEVNGRVIGDDTGDYAPLRGPVERHR